MGGYWGKVRNRGQEGFTLVELMIVVAIIGILAAIAIPNYQKYQAKARTSEGKIQLASAYTAEKSFFVEYSSFTGCLASAGYAPDLGSSTATSSRYYAIGFNATGGGGTACGPAGNESCAGGVGWGNGAPSCTAGTDGVTNNDGTYWSANRAAGAGSGASGIAGGGDLPGQTVTSTTFTIGTAGNVDSTPNNTNYDQWTINEGKVVSQTNVGY